MNRIRDIIRMELKMQDRHKTVMCDVCNKYMRSSSLQRHKQVHKYILSLPYDEIKEELRSRQKIKKKQEVKIRRIEEIARENGLATPEEIVSGNTNQLMRLIMFTKEVYKTTNST